MFACLRNWEDYDDFSMVRLIQVSGISYWGQAGPPVVENGAVKLYGLK